MFRRIRGLHPLGASVTPLPPVVTAKNGFRRCQMSPGRQNHLQLRTTALAETKVEVIFLSEHGSLESPSLPAFYALPSPPTD